MTIRPPTAVMADRLETTIEELNRVKAQLSKRELQLINSDNNLMKALCDAASARKNERERCARIADEHLEHGDDWLVSRGFPTHGQNIAAAIRRG